MGGRTFIGLTVKKNENGPTIIIFPSAVDNVNADKESPSRKEPRKVYDGHGFYILRDGKEYTITGQMAK